MQRRRRKLNLHERLDHLFELSWSRHEQLKKRFERIMSAFDDLTREVQEMKDKVGEALVKMQELIDEIKNNPANVAAVTAAVAELDALQTKISEALTPPVV